MQGSAALTAKAAHSLRYTRLVTRLADKVENALNETRMLVLGAPSPYKEGESSLEWRPGYFEELEELLRKGEFNHEARMELRAKYGPSGATGSAHKEWGVTR